LKVAAVLDSAEVLGLVVPDGQPRFALSITLPDGSTVIAALGQGRAARAGGNPRARS
jgi:hypothetical protein